MFYEQLAADHNRRLLIEAEKARLMRAARRPAGHPLVGRTLMGAGERLFRWGARLGAQSLYPPQPPQRGA